MPLEEIAASLGSDSADVDVVPALRGLAQDIEQQIARLTQLRTRVLDIAASGSLSDPSDTWAAALRDRGILEPAAELPSAEQAAAHLIDALHPQGIQGVIDQTQELFSDPVLRRLGKLIRRFQALPDDASDEVIDTLAVEYAAAVPTPANRPPAVDPEVIEKLLGDRLSPAQLRCVRRVRELLERRQG